MSDDDQGTGSSPYATGGGGVRLEHEYAALALTSLVLGEPMSALGDDYRVTAVGLQQERFAAVDDIVVTGASASTERTIRIACRRNPTLGRSSASTVSLFADFLSTLLDSQGDINSGVLRLGLAVSGPSGSSNELSSLTDIARRQPGHQEFGAAVAARGAYTAAVRRRLIDVTGIVEDALLETRRNDSPGVTIEELSWRLLRSLFVLQERLEGDVAPGRTSLVSRLQRIATDASRANDLRLRLVEIAAGSAIRAGVLDRSMLRRELRSFGELGESLDFAAARPQVALLEELLRGSTRAYLPTLTGGSLSLERTSRCESLVGAIRSLPPGGVLLVHGEPDSGKSALALQAVDSMRSQGSSVIAMSLRDLPRDVLSIRGGIGLDPGDLLSAAPSGPQSVLLLDGTEVVQEADDEVLRTLLRASAATGMKAVLVARDDAKGAVVQCSSRAGLPLPVEFLVEPLTDEELSNLVAGVPELATLALDARAGWFLKRLGLVELLLLAAREAGDLPKSLSTEADVFAAVWSSVIRTSERVVHQVSPDDRENAVLHVARRVLGCDATTGPSGSAMASLRSDGVLLSRDRASAWRMSDVFASDVLRDFALAALLARDGIEVLADCGAPRLAIRAARLAAQARLAEAVSAGPDAIAPRWAELRAEYDSLAAAHGARWAELPWEALLSAGWADQALSALTPVLLADRSAISEAVRCLQLRFSSAGSCDPVVGAALVSWVVENVDLAAAFASYQDESVTTLVLSWMRGMAQWEALGRDVVIWGPLRRRLREVLVGLDARRSDKEWIECLGLLGADLDADAAQMLREFARVSPAFLAPLVESADVALSMSERDSVLLADLAASYYIEQSAPTMWGSSYLDDGIRHHVFGGLGAPMAAWYMGPFAWLLRRDFGSGIRLINLMLDQGARNRVSTLRSLSSQSGESAASPSETEGLELDLLSLGSRLYVGDAHVWSWYRGSSVGPYPCMSALLALERMMDDLVKAGASLRAVAMAVLRDADTLASAGLVFGFLVRHLDEVTDELDCYLEVPEVWHLEHGRVVGERGNIHVQGPDDEDTVGSSRRLWTPRDVSMRLLIAARMGGDATAMARLRAVGAGLREAAGGDSAPAYVRQWAATLDPDAYTFEEQEDGVLVQVDPGTDVLEELAADNLHSERVGEMYRLMNRYAIRSVTPYTYGFAEPPTLPELAHDYEVARSLQQELVAEPLDMVRSSLAGVAAAILWAVALGEETPMGAPAWAVDLLTDSLVTPYVGEMAISGSVSPRAADRVAALALPMSLSERTASRIDDDPPGTVDAAISAAADGLVAGSTSLFLETRRNAALGLARLFAQACYERAGRSCVHRSAWEAVIAGARTVSIGARDAQGGRSARVLQGDLGSVLPEVPESDLMLPQLAPVLVSVLNAASSGACVSGEAEMLLPAVLDAYARSARYWADNNFGDGDEWSVGVAAAVLARSVSTGGVFVAEVAARLADSPAALGRFARDLAIVATYQSEYVPLLSNAWPDLMRAGLECIAAHQEPADRYGREELIRHLVPDPSPSAYMEGLGETLAAARENWLPLEAVASHMADWLVHARGEMSCVDALVGFLYAQDMTSQARPGLSWVRSLVVHADGQATTSGFTLVEWLASVRDAAVLRADSLGDYRSLVDALVLSGYRGARDLQSLDE